MRIATIVFYAIVAVGLALYVAGLDRAALLAVRPDVGWLLVASLMGIVARFWFAEIWIFLLVRLGAQTTPRLRRDLRFVYAKAWLARYLPGGIAWIVGKVYFAYELGVSKTRLAVSSFLEAALQIVVVVATASLILAFDRRVTALGDGVGTALVLVGIAGLVAVDPAIFNPIAAWVYRRFRRTPIDPGSLPGRGTIWAGIAAFTVAAALSGLSLYAMTRAVVSTLSWGDLPYVLGTSNLASALSMLAVFAPAGLGVREAVQVAALVVVITPEQALAVALLMRLWGVVLDVVFLGLAALWRRLARARVE